MHCKSTLLFLLLIPMLACQPNESTFDGKNGLKVLHYKGLGVVKARIEYKNGKADGLYRAYYQSGKLWSETYYKEGQRHGKATFYYENGKVKSEDFYKEDLQDSTSKVYDADGKLKVECSYFEGRYHNRYAAYYPNGQLRQEKHYKHGREDGEQKSFYPNGQLKAVTHFRNGFPGTGTQEYSETGELLNPGVTIQVEETNELALKSEYTYRIRLSVSRPGDQVFFGNLLEGKYMQPSMFPLRKKNGYFEHVYNVPRYASYTEAANLIVKTKTASGNDLVLTRKLNVALNNFY